jgi:DNA-binding transcriptional LysR family regulator
MQKTLERLQGNQFDPRISRRNLGYFYIAAKELNFTRAAKLWGVAQPSLSRGIVLLEDAIGELLFERTGRTVQLTNRGQELLPAAEFFLNQCMDFSDLLEARNDDGKTKIRISAISTLTAETLPKIIDEFEQLHPSISIDLSDGYNNEIIDSVYVGNVDLGVITTPENPAYFRTKLLFKDRYAVAVNSEHRFYERKTVRWEELAREPFATFEKDSSTHRDIEQTLEIIGVHFAPKAHVKYRNTLMGLVKHRGMITALPKLAIQAHPQSGIRAIPIVGGLTTLCRERVGSPKREHSASVSISA